LIQVHYIRGVCIVNAFKEKLKLIYFITSPDANGIYDVCDSERAPAMLSADLESM